MKRAGSHLVAVLAGFVVAALLEKRLPAPVDETAVPAGGLPAEVVPLPGEADSFAVAWRQLALRNLSADQRRAARSTLLEQWAAADPRHLLRYFENRPAPENWEQILSAILREDVGEVFRIAREQGVPTALDRISGGLDPREAFDLLAAEPGVPPRLFAEVASRGTAVDPGFAARADELPAGPVRDHFLTGVLGVQLATGRWEEARETAARIETLGPEAAEEIGEHLAGLSSWQEKGNRLLSLPEDLRRPALAEVMSHATAALATPDDHRALRAFAERMAGSGLEPEVRRIELDVEESAAWGEWALALPEGGTWETLREDALTLWLSHDDTAAEVLLALPPGTLRDTAMRALAEEMRLDHDRDGLVRALDLMSPEARAAAEQALAEPAEDFPE